MQPKAAALLALQNGILCGVSQYSDFDGKRHIHLFETAENKGNPVIADNLPAVCVSVLDRLQPLSSIEDVEWHFTNSPFHTDINFEPLGAGGYLMSLTSTKLGYESITPLSSYQKALNSHQDLNGRSQAHLALTLAARAAL